MQKFLSSFCHKNVSGVVPTKCLSAKTAFILGTSTKVSAKCAAKTTRKSGLSSVLLSLKSVPSVEFTSHTDFWPIPMSLAASSAFVLHYSREISFSWVFWCQFWLHSWRWGLALLVLNFASYFYLKPVFKVLRWMKTSDFLNFLVPTSAMNG